MNEKFFPSLTENYLHKMMFYLLSTNVDCKSVKASIRVRPEYLPPMLTLQPVTKRNKV